MAPRFVSWPQNQEVVEGSNVTIECSLENCSTLIMSRDFVPVILKTIKKSIGHPFLIRKALMAASLSSIKSVETLGLLQSQTSARTVQDSTSSLRETHPAKKNILLSSK